MKMRWMLSISLVLAVMSVCKGQVTDTIPVAPGPVDTVPPPWTYYQALDDDLFGIIDTQYLQVFNADSLAPFFDKLQQLQQHPDGKVRITQIGDSHLQAGFQTRHTRYLFQKVFGNGGRGVMFPYKLAHTNGPFDLYAFSDIRWESKRNVFPDQPMEIGLAGITLGTDKDAFLLKLKVDNDSADMSFSRFLLFHNQDVAASPFNYYTSDDTMILEESQQVVETHYHKIRSGESLGLIAQNLGVGVSQLKRWNGLHSNTIYAGKSLKYHRVIRKAIPVDMNKMDTLSPYLNYWEPDLFQELNFEKPISTLFVGYKGSERVELNGMYLENEQPGVVYSMIGVNGAKYKHYNQSAKFFEQLAVLDNDLIIVSLGTNESLEQYYPPARLKHEMETFYRKLKGHNPQAQLLVCTNPDTYYNQGKNSQAEVVNKVIVEFCEEHHIPYWNAFKLMQGSGGIYQWYRKGLVQRDLIHFNVPGYQAMGALLFYSIMKAYDEYQHPAGD